MQANPVMTRPLKKQSLKSKLKALFLSLVSAGTLMLGEPLFWLMGRRRAAQPALTDTRRILVVRLDQIGDFILTTPFLRELKKSAPLARITLVVKPELAEMAASCPYADDVLTFDWHIARRSEDWRRRLRALYFCAAHLWPRRFDLAIIPRWDADWYCQTFIAYGSGAPKRVGYSEDVDSIKRVHNHGYDRLLTQALHRKSVTHEVERGLDLLREMGGTVAETLLPSVSDSAADDWAQAWLDDNKVRDNEPLIALGPFAGNSALKQWPRSNFAALGRRLRAEYGGRIVVVGGPGNRTDAQAICGEIGPDALTLTGAVLPQTAALLRRCTLFVGDDSGPMHLAAAGIPVVALFGPSCPHRFRPWTPTAEVVWHQLPCSPCSIAKAGENHADCCTVCIYEEPLCMKSITVEEVLAAVERTGVLAACV